MKTQILSKSFLFQLLRALLPAYALVSVVGRVTSFCRMLAEEEGKELGSGHGQVSQAFQTAEYRDFHLHSSTQALLFVHFSSVWQAAKN